MPKAPSQPKQTKPDPKPSPKAPSQPSPEQDNLNPASEAAEAASPEPEPLPDQTVAELAEAGRAARIAIKKGVNPAETLADLLAAHDAYLACKAAPDRKWVKEHRHSLLSLLGDGE